MGTSYIQAVRGSKYSAFPLNGFSLVATKPDPPRQETTDDTDGTDARRHSTSGFLPGLGGYLGLCRQFYEAYTQIRKSLSPEFGRQRTPIGPSLVTNSLRTFTHILPAEMESPVPMFLQGMVSMHAVFFLARA